MAVVKWTDQSLGDVKSIAEFIARDSEKYAKIKQGFSFQGLKFLKNIRKEAELFLKSTK